MTKRALSEASYRRSLGDNLVLRWSTAADAEGLGQLYGHVFRENAEAPLNMYTIAWTNDLLSGRHPLITPGDFALVEDTRQATIVSATCLLAQTWEYEGIPVPIGRPEVVATAPDYRNRGLVRAIFELIHARSAALGHLAQGITGIPYYYRQFGYEYALDLEGSRSVYVAAIPKLKAGEPEPYHLRPATLDDIPRAIALNDCERARGPVSCPTGEAFWRWSLEGQSPEAAEGWDTYMVVDTAGQTVGYVLPRRRRWGDAVRVLGMWVDGAPLVSVLPSLMRALQSHGAAMP